MNEPAVEPVPHDPAHDPLDFFYETDGVAVKVYPFPYKGFSRPGHAHTYDHTSFVAHGAMHWWCEGDDMGVVHAPQGIEIKAGKFHRFVAEEDNTVLMCILNTHGLSQAELEGGLVKEHYHA